MTNNNDSTRTERIFAGFPHQEFPSSQRNSEVAHDDGHIRNNASGYNKNAVTAESKISTSKLHHKILGDVASGSTVAFVVAPFLTIVDKAIVERAAGTQSLFQSGISSMRAMVQNPVAYYKSPTFLFMWAVYASTYSTANSLKTLCEHDFASERTDQQRQTKPATTTTITTNANPPGFYTVFFGTAVVNSCSSIIKDRAYAKMFGTNLSTASVPRLSYAMWMCRDFTVIGSSFVLPDVTSDYVAEQFNMEKADARKIAQLALPIASQFIAGPLHLMGLDMYNRNLDHKTWSQALRDRGSALQKGFAPIVSARIARIFPGYSIGGVLNTHWRDGWRASLLAQHRQRSSLPAVGVLATTPRQN